MSLTYVDDVSEVLSPLTGYSSETVYRYDRIAGSDTIRFDLLPYDRWRLDDGSPWRTAQECQIVEVEAPKVQAAFCSRAGAAQWLPRGAHVVDHRPRWRLWKRWDVAAYVAANGLAASAWAYMSLGSDGAPVVSTGQYSVVDFSAFAACYVTFWSEGAFSAAITADMVCTPRLTNTTKGALTSIFTQSAPAAGSSDLTGNSNFVRLTRWAAYPPSWMSNSSGVATGMVGFPGSPYTTLAVNNNTATPWSSANITGGTGTGVWMDAYVLPRLT